MFGTERTYRRHWRWWLSASTGTIGKQQGGGLKESERAKHPTPDHHQLEEEEEWDDDDDEEA